MMTKILTVVATSALVVSLWSTVIAICLKLEPKDDLLTLTGLLLSWPVISGALAIGGASTFSGEIKALLKRVAEK